MRNIRVLPVLALLVLPLLVGTSVADHHKNKAKIGEKAPNFTLPNLEGEKVSLSDYTETDKEQIVILEWINPDCPFCTRVHEKGLVNRMLKKVNKITDGNVVHLEINSTHYMGPKKTGEYLKEHGVQSTALMDKSGKVGHMYNAKTTPHMYVIDSEGILRYQGAFDDDPDGEIPVKKKENYVVNAVRQIVNGEEVSPQKVKPWGCSVKYE